MSIDHVLKVLKIVDMRFKTRVKAYLEYLVYTRSYYRKENAADVSTNQELLSHVTIVLRARIFGSLVSVLNSGGHFMKYWGDECQGPCKIYMSVPW